jgi:hypothetical membrane protein
MKMQRGSIFRPEHDYYKIAGIIMMIGCFQFILAVNLAETMFPGFSIAKNTINTLGSSTPLIEPSAIIFNLSIIILGILFLIAVYLILKSGGCRLFSSCLAISAIFAIGVGIFNQYLGSAQILYNLTFLFGSLAVLFSYRLGLNIPMVIISFIIGLTALLTLLLQLILGDGSINFLVTYLGVGGTQILILYPIIFYLTALGGYLTSRGEDWVRIRFTKGYW